MIIRLRCYDSISMNKGSTFELVAENRVQNCECTMAHKRALEALGRTL